MLSPFLSSNLHLTTCFLRVHLLLQTTQKSSSPIIQQPNFIYFSDWYSSNPLLPYPRMFLVFTLCKCNSSNRYPLATCVDHKCDQPLSFFHLTLSSHVCKLNKTLYGLRQAHHGQFNKFNNVLIGHIFTCNSIYPRFSTTLRI